MLENEDAFLKRSHYIKRNQAKRKEKRSVDSLLEKASTSKRLSITKLDDVVDAKIERKIRFLCLSKLIKIPKRLMTAKNTSSTSVARNC